MIIEQITLSNWLSYPAKWEQNGELVEPCLRFDQEQVYLIFGRNGAGKSSIMEAILFALFGNYSRSSNRQDVKREGAIRAGEKRAMVELVFSLNGQRHKVKRILDTRTAKAQYSSWDEKAKRWIDGPSQIKPINDKIEKLLGMNQDLFCGTVILEQGNTGRFMELNPGEQVEHVNNLLGLNIYSRYHEKAKELANQRKRDVKTREDELEKLAGTTTETVQNAEMGMHGLEDELKQIEIHSQALSQLLTKVQLVEKSRGDLEAVEQKIELYEKQLTGKNEIIKADQIVQNWRQIEPLLREVQQARRQLTTQQSRVTEFERELLAKQEQRLVSQNMLDDEIQPAYDKSYRTLEKTKEYLETLREKSTEAKKQQDSIRAELELDARQKEIQAQQRNRQQKLKKLSEVETDYQLWTELNRVVPELDKIVSDLLESEQGISTITASQQSLTAELEALADRRMILNQLKEQSENLSADLVAAQKHEERIRNELNTNETLLKKREEAHGESICPTCGTSLEGELLDQFHQELNRLQKAVDEGQSALKEAHQHMCDLEEKTTAINKQVRQEETAIAQDESRLATEQKNLESRKTRSEIQKHQAQNQWRELKDSLSYCAHIITDPTKECLELARKRLNAMSNVQKTRDSLMKIQAAFESDQAELDRIQGQRQHEPGTFSQSHLDEAVRIIDELDNEIKQAKRKRKTSEDKERELFQSMTKTKSNLTSLSERIQNLEQELLPQEHKSLDESARHQQDSSQRFDNNIATLGWSVHYLQTIGRAANNDQQAEQEIRAWVDEHRPLAEQISELRKAEGEIDDLHSRYAALDEQIQSYPDDVQQGESKNIERDLQIKRNEKTAKDAELQEWREKAWKERESLSRKQTLQKEHERLVAEEKDFRDLAALLAPPGTRSSSVGGPLLQAIMRDALKNVADRASNILEEWNQTTQILLSKDSLEFKVIDLESGSSERHYQLFSGGEKFMVALAMALAIGEVVSDTGHTDCLFIDEGFGLLDSYNRVYVAQEIVSKLVRSGRRKQVIVITHMEDLRGAFADGHSRYHLVKDGSTTRLLEEEAYAKP